MRAWVATAALLLAGCVDDPVPAQDYEPGQVIGNVLHTYRLEVLVGLEEWRPIPPSQMDVRYKDTAAKFVMVRDSETSYRFVPSGPQVWLHAAWGVETPLPPPILGSVNLTDGTIRWDQAWIPVLAAPDGRSRAWDFTLGETEWHLQRSKDGPKLQISAESTSGQTFAASIDQATGLVHHAAFHVDGVLQYNLTLAGESEAIRTSLFLKDAHAWKLVEIEGERSGGDDVDSQRAPVDAAADTLFYAAAAYQCETDPSELGIGLLVGPSLHYALGSEAAASWSCTPTFRQSVGYKIACPDGVPSEVGIEMDPGPLGVHTMRYRASLLAVEYDLLEFVRDGDGWRVQPRDPIPSAAC